jgi:protein kinase A
VSADPGYSGTHFTLDSFDLGRVIGTGGCAYVRVAYCKAINKPAVIKTYSKAQLIQSAELRHCRNELQTLGTIRSLWIPRLLGSGQDERTVFLVMDFIQGGEVFRLLRQLGRFTLREVEFYAAEVFCALCDLHMWRFIYRDLKPEHLLLDSEGHVKIVDLHLTKFMKSGGRTFTVCGTPEYMPPEMVESMGVSYESDWWQFGILLYELLSGKTPFYDPSPYVLYTKILIGEVRFPGYFSHSACSLINSLLSKQLKKRPSEEQIQNHPFFSAIDWPHARKQQLSPPIINRVKSSLEDCYFDTFPQPEEFEAEASTSEESFAGF